MNKNIYIAWCGAYDDRHIGIITTSEYKLRKWVKNNIRNSIHHYDLVHDIEVWKDGEADEFTAGFFVSDFGDFCNELNKVSKREC